MKKILLCFLLSVMAFAAYSKGDGTEQFAPDTMLLQGYESVDLGLSVKWAACNVGANEPYETGDLFAWGETETDVAKVKLGGGWRMPTKAEMQELLDNCN